MKFSFARPIASEQAPTSVGATAVDVDTTPVAPSRPFRLTPQGVFARVSAIILLALVVFYLPHHSSDFATTASYAAIFAIVALSLNLLVGYTGQLSLGHQGFLGIGALAAAYAQARLGLPFGLCLLVGIGVGALTALLLGLVALRVTGLYLALVTLVFGLTLRDSVFQIGALTNGGAGQQANRPSLLLDNYAFYLFCLAMLAAVIYLDRRLTATRSGRALKALREDERVASSFGIHVTTAKLAAFVLSGAIAGLAGGLFAFNTQQFSGADYDFNLALTFVVMTVVGGTGSRPGVVLGGAFFAVLSAGGLLQHALASVHSSLDHLPVVGAVLYGPNQQFVPDVIAALLLLQTLIFNPNGIATIADPIARWLSFQRFERSHGLTSARPGGGTRA